MPWTKEALEQHNVICQSSAAVSQLRRTYGNGDTNGSANHLAEEHDVLIRCDKTTRYKPQAFFSRTR